MMLQRLHMELECWAEYNSLKPYLMVNASTNFAATILNNDTKLQYVIPEFWQEYRYDVNSLINASNASPNILGFSQSRDIVGTVQVGISDGITLSGTGKTIIQLNNYTGNELILRGDVKTAVLKFITSPLDLMNIPHGAAHGFTIPSSLPSFAGKDSTHYGTASWTTTWNYRTQVCALTDRGYWYQLTTLTPHTSNNLVPLTMATTNMGNHTLITSVGGYSAVAPPDTGYSVWASCQLYLNHGVQDGTVSGVTLALYDTMPAYDQKIFSGVYEQKFEFLEHPTYLYVEPNGENITIKGEAAANRPFLEITNVPSNVPYQIIKNNLVIVTGMSSASGQILIDNVDNAPSLVGGLLYLYPDSLSYRGPFSTVIFDNVNNETIHINTIEDKVYVVHAYARIPVVGTVTVTDMNLDGTLDLPYLNKQYVGGNILVPIIPGYDTINMKLNGVSASIDYANILGGTGIKIVDPATSTIPQYNVEAPISSAEASVGTVAYAIATSTGTLNAIITETISGTVFIQNTYILEQNPPVPPPPVRRDPLSGWVDIFVNGALVKQTSLGINPNPGFTETNTVSGNTVTRSVTYTYGDYVLVGNTAVTVSAGDFVEFYVYAKIHGDIDGYAAPGGYSIVSSSGTSSATANIAFAHIQTSM